MDLQSRKIEFIQEFLELQSENAISRFEKFLKKEKNTVFETDSEPMTKAELNKRIDQSEADFKNNRFKKTSELLTKYK